VRCASSDASFRDDLHGLTVGGDRALVVRAGDVANVNAVTPLRIVIG
jgi:hypothetical protein